MVYFYENRVMVEFTNKTRASYSRKRYGPLLNKVVQLSVLLDRKIWNYFEEKEDKIFIYYWNQKDNKIEKGIIDKKDEKVLENNYWTLNCNGYFFSRSNGETKFLHQEVLKLERGEKELVVDHINRKKTDNTSSNLRLVSCSVNSLNRDSKNTYYDSDRNLWRGRVNFQGKEYTKFFSTEEEASFWAKQFKNSILQQESSTTIPNGSRQ